MGREAHRSVPRSIQTSPAATNPPEATRGVLSSLPAERAANASVTVPSHPSSIPSAVFSQSPSLTKHEPLPPGKPRTPSEHLTVYDELARHADATNNDLDNLETSAQHRVMLPGISGVPIHLMHRRDTAETALRAAERVYNMYLEKLGVDPQTRADQAVQLAQRSAETMRNLFSGEQDTNPDGALVAGIQALQIASDLYTQLVSGTIESIPSNGNNHPSTSSETEKN